MPSFELLMAIAALFLSYRCDQCVQITRVYIYELLQCASLCFLQKLSILGSGYILVYISTTTLAGDFIQISRTSSSKVVVGNGLLDSKNDSWCIMHGTATIKQNVHSVLQVIIIVMNIINLFLFCVDGGAEKVSTTKNYSTVAIASEPSPYKNGILYSGNTVATLVCCCPLFKFY